MTTRNLAQNIAKQIATEPAEILKEAGTQIAGVESDTPQAQASENEKVANTSHAQEEIKDKSFANRRIQALETEIEDIRKQDTFKDLQEKISAGEIVPLENFSELSMEQKQVLKAQMEAVKNQNRQAQYQLQEVPVIHSKPSRRFGAGQKHEAEKQQTRVEKPIPPSG